MGRKSSSLALVLFFLAAGASAKVVEIRNVTPPPTSVAEVKFTVFYNSSGDEKLLVDFKRELVRRGAFRVNAFLPSYVACYLPDSLDGGALSQAAGLELAFQAVDFDIESKSPYEPGLDSSRDENWIVECYRAAKKLAAAVEGSTPLYPGGTGEGEVLDSVFVVPHEVISRYQSRLEGRYLQEERNPSQNSEFLLGDVLVQLVLPESDGNDEDWSDKQVSDVAMGAYSAMLSFQEKFSYAPINFTFKEYIRARTVYEPINYNSNSDYLWINDVMINLGYDDLKDGTFGLVHQFNNDGRRAYGTDWVFTAFIANSMHAYRHLFKNANYTAYAYLGGPFLVMPYPTGTNPYSINQVLLFSQVFQHEASHVFWALDEYLSAMGDCSEHSGYLNYYNRNKILNIGSNSQPLGCQQIVPCIMARAKEDLGRPLCYYTAGMIGVIDSDDDGVPDIFQSTPKIKFANAAVETITTSQVVVKCKAFSPTVPNRNPVQDPSTRIDYAVPLRNGILRVNDAGNIYMVPDDGRWDEIEEDITVKLQLVSAGLTRVSIRLLNIAGVYSPWYVKKIYYVGLKYSYLSREITNEGIGFSWRMTGETFGARFDMYRIEGGNAEGDTLIFPDIKPVEEPVDEYTHFALFDSTVEAGKTYCYFVRGTFELDSRGGKRRFVSDSDMIRVTASMPIRTNRIVSAAVPNPFVSHTTFSIKVPASYREVIPTSDSSNRVSSDRPSLGLIKEEIPTRLEAFIFDVTGKLVKRLFTGSVYSTVLTLQWNGTNNNNEPVSSGVYFLKVYTKGITEVRKVIIVR